MRLLVTRPEEDAARTAQALRARGHAVLIAPLLRIEAIEADLSGSWTAVLMTSANAARALSGHRQAAALLRLPAFTVGDRSAEAARAAGFTEVISADGALSDLVRLVAARFAGDKARLLYLAGEDRSGDAMADLAALGVDLRVIVLYRAAVGAALSDALSEALRAGRLDGALHYSRRSAAALLALAEQAGLLNAVLGLIHYCLSAEVAAPLRQRGAERIQVAASPNEAALIDAIPA
jgi:uroporphyrinogen-III synthase